MKMHEFILGAGIVLLAASCESTRQSTTGTIATDGSTASMTQPAVSTATQTGTTATTNSTGSVNSSTSSPNTNPASPATPASAAGAMPTQPGNAVTVSGSTMANSTMNSTTRTDTSITPPGTVQSSFSTKYPNASNVRWYQYNNARVPIDWDMTGWPALTSRDFAVTYDENNAEHHAWYDAQGNWVGSTNQMKDYKGLPAPITTMLSSKYAGYNITDVHAETYKDRSAYQVEMTKGTDKVKMVVDANGNILKQKTKTVDANGNEVKEKIKIEN